MNSSLALRDFPANVVACNYEPELLSVRALHPEELALARLLKRLRPDIPPSFTRYWIDLVIAGSRDHPRRFFEPWSFESTQSTNVDLTESDGLLFRDAGAKLRARWTTRPEPLWLAFKIMSNRLSSLSSLTAGAPIAVPFAPARGWLNRFFDGEIRPGHRCGHARAQRQDDSRLPSL